MVVGQLEIQLLANMARLQSDMEKAQRTVSNVVGKMNNVLGAIGVGISVDFLLGLATKSNEYSKSLASLSTQISGATNQIKELDAASKSLAVQFGTPAIKQSAAFYEILSAGITDTVQATALLTEANRLAIGGNADLMISVDGLTSIIKGYGSAAGTTAEIADTMFTASLAGKLSIQELSENIGKVIPLATTMGVSLEEVTAGISALTLGGISAKESVTGMRAILASVAKPSSEAARLAKEIGLEFNSAAVQANGFAKFMEDVKTKTKGSSDQMAILFGGVESLIPALALTGNAGIEFNNIMGQMANKAGATEDAFNKMAASPGFKFDKFMATMSNIAITLGDALANVLTPAAELAAKALNKLFGMSNVSGVEKQVQLVKELTEKVESMANRKNIPLIGGFIFDKKEFDLLEHQLEMAKVDLADMQKAQQAATVVQKQSTVEIIKNSVALEKNNTIATKAARIAEVKSKTYNTELYLLKQYDDEAKRARDITQSVATEQEIYNQKLEELNRLKPYLSVETYERALQKLNGTTKQTAVVTRNTTDEVSQLLIQAGRNIQSTLANSIFNFFDDGLKGMVKNVISAVGRIVSEFAALKLSQSIGLDRMFSMGGVGGTGSSLASGGNLLNFASLGTNAMSLVRGGFGLNSLIGGGLTSIGGSGLLGSFGAGLSGGSSAASFIAAESATAGAGMAAGIGSTIGAVAGPLMAAAAATAIFKSLAGDARLGGAFGKGLNAIGDIPIIGDFIPVVPLMNFLFGREPYKFRQQSFQGTASSGGFDGDFTNVFRSKGSGFAGNKHKSFSQEFTLEQQTLFDDTLRGFYISAHNAAVNLGLSTDLVDNFSKEIQIKSEKGKTVTEEAIAEMFKGISNELAENVLPIVSTFRKAGEDSFATLNRLNSEFIALTQGAMNLGASSDYANQLISALSINTRTAYLEYAGGAEKFLADTATFNQEFLTQAERMAPFIKQVEDGFTSLGFAADTTREQFKVLVQTLLQSASEADRATGAFLLSNNKLVDFVMDYKESQKQLTDSVSDVVKETAQASAQIADTRQQRRKEEQQERLNKMLDQANTAISAIGQSIDKLLGLSKAAQDASRQLIPQSVDDARANILSALNFDKRGNVLGIGNINLIDQESLKTLANQSTSGFTSSFDFELSQAKNYAILQMLNDAADKSIAAARETMSLFASERNRLTKYATGTAYVPRTGPAIVHQGERIIPADQNKNLAKTEDSKELKASIDQLIKLFEPLIKKGAGGPALRTAS